MAAVITARNISPPSRRRRRWGWPDLDLNRRVGTHSWSLGFWVAHLAPCSPTPREQYGDPLVSRLPYMVPPPLPLETHEEETVKFPTSCCRDIYKHNKETWKKIIYTAGRVQVGLPVRPIFTTCLGWLHKKWPLKSGLSPPAAPVESRKMPGWMEVSSPGLAPPSPLQRPWLTWS